MISITNLSMSYGSKILFTDVNINILPNKRYGIVGSNGAGKSTLLRLLAGEEEPDLGEITISKNTRLGWLKQDQFKYEDTSVLDVVIAGRTILWNALKAKEKILAKEECSEKDGFKLGELEQIICDNDGYTAESFAGELLLGLGVKEKHHFGPLSALSGGYKLRVLLAQSLFDNPDILLLDEPTNHLDIPSIYWLENYLKEKFKGILVFISHDIEFLNRMSTHILDIDYGEVRQYVGNYDAFIKEKKFVIEQKISQREYLEKKIERLQVFIDKFRASASRARQSQSKEKMIDKMELPNIEKSSRISPPFSFKQKRPSGKVVVTVKGISKSFGEQHILENINFTVRKGEKVIIIGPNGIGKSTLLKILLGYISPDKGEYEWGYETHWSYFAQDHHEELRENLSIFDWMTERFKSESLNTVRGILGQVLFRQDEVHKNILTISGGEGARLLLAKIMLEQNNVLVLDEPTNHLDIESKETLKLALCEYPGTILMVSHDRYFATGIATRVIAITNKGITDFLGSYEEYLAKHGKDWLAFPNA